MTVNRDLSLCPDRPDETKEIGGTKVKAEPLPLPKTLHPTASTADDDDLQRELDDISIESIYVRHVHIDDVPIDDSDELFATLKFSMRKQAE